MSFGNKTWPPDREPQHRCLGVRRDGLPCERFVLPGDAFCHMHEGTPVSRKQTFIGLLYLGRPALARLARLVESPNEEVALKACLALLDRMGIGPSATLHLDDTRAEDLTLLTSEELAARALALAARLGAPAAQPALQAAQPAPGNPQHGAQPAPATSQPAAPEDADVDE